MYHISCHTGIHGKGKRLEIKYSSIRKNSFKSKERHLILLKASIVLNMSTKTMLLVRVTLIAIKTIITITRLILIQPKLKGISLS